MAYAVGLITTDGCLYSDFRHVSFTSKDLEQITNLRSILGIYPKIGQNFNVYGSTYRVQFSNVQLFDWLISIGLYPNKSLSIGVITIPNEYFRDFLRGHLDGDGSITTYKQTYTKKNLDTNIYNRLTLRFISASQTHMKWLQSKIIDIFHVTGRLHISKANKIGNSMYILKYGKIDALELLSKIYYSDEILCLKRKRNIYEQFLKYTK